MTTPTQQDYQAAYNDGWADGHDGVKRNSHYRIQQCAKGCGELEVVIRLISQARNHQEKKDGCESCLNNLNAALELLRKNRAQKGD